MSHRDRLADLEAFAKERIGADRHPKDIHNFSAAECPTCGVVPFELTIEHHTGSQQGNFRGLIFGRCSECGRKVQVFGFSGPGRERVWEEKPVCECGGAQSPVPVSIVAQCGAGVPPAALEHNIVASQDDSTTRIDNVREEPQFLVGRCERFEGDEGLSGFFDEGVVVGKCHRCGRNRVMVYVD